MRNVDAPAPSRWATIASSVVATVIVAGLLPANFTILLTIGSNIPASLTTPK